MSTVKHLIKQWKEDFFTPNQSDVLLTLIQGKNAFEISEFYLEESVFSLPDSTLLKRIFVAHQQSIKETGSPIFGIVKDTILFSLAGKDYAMPLFLAGAEIYKNRFNNTFKVQQTEDFYLNPLLFTVLSIEIEKDVEKILENLKANGLSFQTVEGIWGANFHPHRFVLQKELDGLIRLNDYSNPLKAIFGEENESEKLQFSDSYLFPADESQRKAIESVKDKNIVIQGPPGTGKSQVISNLIGKILGSKKSALLIAEKSVALEVIYDQLKSRNLHHFSLLYHHELKSKQFINSIKNTWKYIEKLPLKPIVITQQTTLLKQGLDLTLNRLKQKDLIGGTDIIQFRKVFKKDQSSTYSSVKPLIPQWEEERIILEKLEKTLFPIFGQWTSLNLNRFSVQEIDTKINQLYLLIKKNNLQDLTIDMLDNQRKLSGLVSLFYHDDQPLSVELFKADSKQQKKFIKLFKKYKTTLEKEELLRKEERNWKKDFSLSELEEYTKVLASTNPFSLRNRLTKNKLLKYTDLNLVQGKKAIENLVELKLVRKELITIREALRKENLPEELPVLEHINYTILKLKSVETNQLNQLFSLSQEERNALKNKSTVLQEIHHYLSHYFTLVEDKAIQTQIENIQSLIPKIIENSSYFAKISDETKEILKKSKSIDESEQIIYESHWKDFKGRFPTLAEIDGDKIQEKIEEIISSFHQESDEFCLFIQQQIKEKFEEYHQLLQTPARKLNQREKELKATLRRGKSILVKAFEKKRIFPSVRELLESEAKLWIQLLHPVFLCSPYSVAKSLPIDYTFELGIFDEASQIPISHVAGSLQRSKKVVICGDQQQMAPQFYFQRKDKHQSDVLHHASFYLENIMLTHHYRSKYPALIEFSNHYFYENKLKVFPTFGQPENVIDVINAKGLFINRKNEEEAKIVAQIISEKIKNKEFNFGLVAFSQTQLTCILEKIPNSLLGQLENKDSIFIQTLENVQGDQCEHLIISMGYANNKNGEFHKRFGPLNQEQGHRRLNVLMSRAISKITFVRSVTSQDFSISDNDGVELLRKLMIYLEETKSVAKQVDSGLKINDLGTSFTTTQALVDYYRVMKVRGWEIKFD